MSIYTRNEWGRCKTTLETSGEDLNFQVGKDIEGLMKEGKLVPDTIILSLIKNELKNIGSKKVNFLHSFRV